MSERPPAAAALAVAVALLCSACLKVGPDYAPPPANLPPDWAGGAGFDAGRSPAPLWWGVFRDPMLDELVRRAVAHNRDVAAAVASVRASRAARRGAVAAYFPTLDASGDYRRRRPSATNFSPTAAREFDDWSFGFDSGWEIDLFGGIRRSNEQAAAELEAAGADLDDALVSVLAEVARNYVEVRSLAARLAIARDNAASQGETLDVTRWRYEAGLSPALDVEQARSSLAQTLARVPELDTERIAAANRLAVLVGEPAGSLDAELAAAAPVPSVPSRVAIGIPTDLLRRRPDVAAAERRLAAATAAIGVAKADLYPRLSLTGTFGVAATDFSRLDTAAARGYSIGPTLSWNLFDAGRLRSVVTERSAEADRALAQWEAAVLAAYEEVVNALAGFANQQRRLEALDEGRAAAREAQRLARLQYEHGELEFDRVLEAERQTLVLEEAHAISRAAVATGLVAVYKALGGGWQAFSCDDGGCR